MAEKEKEIKEAIETLEDISSDEAKERIAELRQKYIMDMKSQLRTAEEKGSKNEKTQIAKKMLEKSIPIETIIEITGLSQKEIEKINS